MTAQRSLLLVIPLTLAALACSEVESGPVAPTDGVVGASHHGPPISAAPNAASARNFVAPLDPDQEVPPVESDATGLAHFQLARDGGELSYHLNVGNIQNVLMAHIHMAPAGQNGGIVVWLLPSPSARAPELIPGRSSGALVTGTITDADIIGGLGGTGIDGLVEAIEAGNTYVNVHTMANPAGEIRGQIMVAGPR